MLDVLKYQKLFEGLQLTTVSSILNLDFDENEYDIVLICYSIHYFKEMCYVIYKYSRNQ